MESEGCRDGTEAERVEARGITEESRAQSVRFESSRVIANSRGTELCVPVR